MKNKKRSGSTYQSSHRELEKMAESANSAPVSREFIASVLREKFRYVYGQTSAASEAEYERNKEATDDAILKRYGIE